MLLQVEDEERQETGEASRLPSWFFLVFVLGIVLIFAGALVALAATTLGGGGGSGSTGIVIFIGPIPIALGAGQDFALIVFAMAVLTAVATALFFVLRRK